MPPTEPALRNAAVFGLFLALFSAAWFSVWTFDYGVRDDYRDLVTESSAYPAAEAAAEGAVDRIRTRGNAVRRRVSEGRPLTALAARFTYGTVSEVEHLRYVRFVGILGIALLAWSLYRVLLGAGHGRLPSFCVAAIACSTLPFQVWAHWASAVTYPFAAALSGFAFLLADRAATEAASSPPSSSSFRKWFRAGGAGLALSAALALYQPAAMFYWVFAAVVLVEPNRGRREMFRRLGWHSAVGAAGLASGYLSARAGWMLHPTYADRTDLVSNVPGQLKWFFLDAFPHAANFVIPSPSRLLLPDAGSTVSFPDADRILAWVFCLLIAGGLVLHLRTAGGRARWKFAVAVFLLGASFLPIPALEVHTVAYRMLAAPSGLLVLYAYFGIVGVTRGVRPPSLPKVALGAAALAVVAVSATQVRVGLVEPQVREREFLRRELTGSDLSRFRGVHLIVPTREDTFAPLRRLEYGQPSAQVPSVARAMVRLVLRETAPAEARIPVTTARFDEPAAPPPGSLVVDLRELGTPP